jgi:hypothetical protein
VAFVYANAQDGPREQVRSRKPVMARDVGGPRRRSGKSAAFLEEKGDVSIDREVFVKPQSSSDDGPPGMAQRIFCA